MNTKLLIAVLGLLTASAVPASVTAASTDGSLSADIAAIPLCEQEVLANAGYALTKNDRKLMCQTQLKVDELLKIKPEDTATLKAMCNNVACTAALKALYPMLPNCRYKDWAFKVSVETALKYCGIDPETITAGSEAGNATSPTVGDGATNATTRPPINWTASSSSRDGADFAPIGVTPSPSPTTQAPPAQQVPTPAPSSAGNVVYATSATAAAIVITVAAAVL